jgi:ribosomal protein S6
VLQELERTLKIADEVLRFISVASSTVSRKERSGKAKGSKALSDLATSSADASTTAE